METKISSVYFIIQDVTKVIKIGVSESPNPTKRISGLKTASSFNLNLIGYILTNEPYKLENKLHKKFTKKRTNGEWFNITTTDAVNEINSNVNGVITLENFNLVDKKYKKLSYEDAAIIIDNSLSGLKTYNKNKCIKHILINYPEINQKFIADKFNTTQGCISKIKKKMANIR